MVLYSHLFKNFPEFVEIHTVKGFGIVNKAEVDVFLEVKFCCCCSVTKSWLTLYDPMDWSMYICISKRFPIIEAKKKTGNSKTTQGRTQNSNFLD